MGTAFATPSKSYLAADPTVPDELVAQQTYQAHIRPLLPQRWRCSGFPPSSTTNGSYKGVAGDSDLISALFYEVSLN